MYPIDLAEGGRPVGRMRPVLRVAPGFLRALDAENGIKGRIGIQLCVEDMPVAEQDAAPCDPIGDFVQRFRPGAASVQHDQQPCAFERAVEDHPLVRDPHFVAFAQGLEGQEKVFRDPRAVQKGLVHRPEQGNARLRPAFPDEGQVFPDLFRRTVVLLFFIHQIVVIVKNLAVSIGGAAIYAVDDACHLHGPDRL